jgi:AAA15 family ATPase/GTPase
LLRIAAIYGANASGKSNVCRAFDFMTDYISSSFEFGGSKDSLKGRRRNQIAATPFMFDNASRGEKSVFEVFFIIPDKSQKTYQYGFALKNGTVLEEWLYSKAKTAREYKTVFYRNTESKVLDFKISGTSEENIKTALEDETLIVSLGAKLKIPVLKSVYNWFMNNETIDFSNDVESLIVGGRHPKGFADINVQDKVVNFIQSFDDSIVGFDVRKIPLGNNLDPEKERYHIDIKSKHRIMNSDETISISLGEESEGTLKMFSLFSVIQEVLNNGSVLFVDELNTKLHPLLVRNIILTFANLEINTNNAQLIFTTHDTWQLSNNLLRRDEIWFTEKDSDGISTLYSLADFSDGEGVKIRKDESYGKNYLLGKYGAIPTLKAIDFLNKD